MSNAIKFSLVAGLILCMGYTAQAELQNVEIDGSLRIRHNWFNSAATPDLGSERNRMVQPWFFNNLGFVNPLNGFRSPGLPFFGLGLPIRPLGGGTGFVTSLRGDLNDDGPQTQFTEMRTRLGVKADFTEDVTMYVEFDSYEVWGQDFRADYITGIDGYTSTSDIQLYQAYVEANNMFGYPVRLRIGRQEMSLGSEWLIGVNDASSSYQGLSFDGIRGTYATDVFSIDAFWAKLADNQFTPDPTTGSIKDDDDVNLYGVYGSYLGIEDITLDAYWLYLRDGRESPIIFGAPFGNDTYSGIFGEWLEDIFGVDDYTATNLHTIGLRGAGEIGQFDFEAEAAYQFGDADAFGRFFTGAIIPPFVRYGDDEAEFENFGANLELGYTFDMTYSPRVYIGGAYLGGEDNRDITFWEWLWGGIYPFYQGEASVSFNRLFSNWEYSEFLENSELSNVWLVRGGVSANPTEDIDVLLAVTYFETLEAFDDTWPDYFLWGNRLTWFSPLSWITEEHDTYLGTEVGLYVTYHYTEDLSFEVGAAYLFAGEGLEDGNYSAFNGLGYNGGTGDDDPIYVYLQSMISF